MSQTDMIYTATIPWTINATTTGSDLVSLYVNKDTSNKAINAKSQGTISTRMFKQNQITLFTVIKAKSLYQLEYLRFTS